MNAQQPDWYRRIPERPDTYRDTPIATVGELIARLQAFDPACIVYALWDTMPNEIWRVIEHEGRVLVDTE